MVDLLIIELTIGLFLALAIVRPFLRTFRGVDGIGVLPIVAAVLCVAVVPAFGFRPELIPLTFFSILFAIFALPRAYDILRRLRVDDYGEINIAAAAAAALSLIVCMSFALVYLPRPVSADYSAGVFSESMAVKDEKRGETLVLQITRPDTVADGAVLPTAILSPPVLGSTQMVDAFQEALAAKGVFVVCVSREKTDVPFRTLEGKEIVPEAKKLALDLGAFLWGRTREFAAVRGTELETSRTEDFLLALDIVKSAADGQDSRFKYADTSSFYAIGYGAGGGAALLLAASPSASFVKGAVAIEPTLLSAIQVSEKSGVDAQGKKLNAVVRAWDALGLRKIEDIGRGKAGFPASTVPTMMILSDRALLPEDRDSRYALEVRYLRAAKAKCLALSLAGAGAADFSDAPWEYPVYSKFSPAAKTDKAPLNFSVERATDAIVLFMKGGYRSIEKLAGAGVESKN